MLATSLLNHGYDYEHPHYLVVRRVDQVLVNAIALVMCLSLLVLVTEENSSDSAMGSGDRPIDNTPSHLYSRITIGLCILAALMYWNNPLGRGHPAAAAASETVSSTAGGDEERMSHHIVHCFIHVLGFTSVMLTVKSCASNQKCWWCITKRNGSAPCSESSVDSEKPHRLIYCGDVAQCDREHATNEFP